MYSILISVAVAMLCGVGGMLLGWWGWIWASVIAIVAFLVTSFLISRRLMGKLGPAMGVVKRQMESRMPDLAMQTLQDMMPLSRWVPLLRGQLVAQMGVIAYAKGDEQKAIDLLQHSSRRAADAQLLLACIHYKKGDKQQALQTLQVAALVAKKHSMLHNGYAWMLHKEERSEEAIKVLVRYLKKQPDDEIAKDNLLRLQNKQRATMKGFGMEWYALGVEHPPAQMGQMQTARKGFRTPPKQPKNKRG